MSNQGWTQNDSFDNWDEVSTEAPKPLDPALYHGEIVSAEAAQTGTGKPAVKLEVSAKGLFQGDDLPSERKLFDTVVITREAAFKVKQLAQATGVEPPKSNAFEAVSELADSLVGQPVVFKTKIESYKKDGENRTTHRIERYLTTDQAERVKAGANADTNAGDEAAPQQRTRRGRKAA
jgi:hypothetical protein